MHTRSLSSRSIKKAYEITRDLIGMYLQEGNPVAEIINVSEKDRDQIAQAMVELQAACNRFSMSLKK